jgi:hypothetical protein
MLLRQNMIGFWLAHSLCRPTDATAGSFGRVGVKPQCLSIAEFLYTFGMNPIGLRAPKGAHTARIESQPAVQKRPFIMLEATL